ncbi:4Fe-4S dicluster domain-containing protein [Campylobacter upsaliensis]|uniref:4Fe-4S dicluster domain-containing protein n=1 Tax=Campylobacter upsaliensis TaxID=28080 RepID=UPI001288B383|nr:4Fe-4S dicluster domain-containing protein [Campylobacter upsaliensis]EAI1981076.1 4Fe-4S dicluster domain-containing protein [Campylobacter upsaliensis]EAI8667802.1 4Fe-4S dicluster domain-containing protein [Campylobacter upsaliensis]EAJ1462595.1 4Fe-4S dicluster domain-containing protein [Campylobacter upsaliensis]EAJ5286592.1 4Fe-4S dicluster domain-containing protein [Campylobacter upsaliensis]EAJ7573117.1 4Fe-4S dicluster domain-containing protein [Campylobacter upsaliensis]
MLNFTYIKNEFAQPFDDKITLLEKPNEEEVLITNDPSQKAEIYAPEINFYLKNSKDSILEKNKVVLKLYEMRLSAYENGLDFENTKQISNRILIIASKNEARESVLKEAGFKVISLDESEVLSVFGSAGELCAVVKNKDEEVELDFDILLYEKERQDFKRQSGCYDLANFKDERELLSFLQSKSPNYHFKTFITYNSSVCQYHKRRSEHCAKCAEICPTTAILKDDEERILEFSQIDCLGCGGCVSVCPSGSLDYAPMNRDSFFKMLDFVRGSKICIIPKKMPLEHLNLKLGEGVLPFMIEGEKWLSNLHFLSLLQASGANLVFYTDFVSRGSAEAIGLLNAVFERKFGKKAVFVASDEKELENALTKLEFIEGLNFSFHNNTQTNRENFAVRLRHLIGDEDLGVVESGEWLRYGDLRLNVDTCTLCLACVGACNVGALVADSKENALKFNPSLCTTCGYCEASCAEKDTLKLERSGLRLEKSYFDFRTLTKDELFACVECGKEFATKKAVEKIASLMRDKFANDEAKLKSLYCCADCKAKVMLGAMMRG